MDWAALAIQWLHVLGGIFWFGGALFGNLVLFPVILRLPDAVQRDFMRPFLERSDRIVVPVAITTIVLGVLRGTVFGRIHSLADLATPYGIAWLIGLVLATTLLAVGVFYLAPEAKRLLQGAEAGQGLGAAGRRLQVVALLDLLGFFVVFSAMIAMRFL